MRVGIIQLKTAIAITTLWLYFGNVRTKSNADEIILALEEIMESNIGYSIRMVDMINE